MLLEVCANQRLLVLPKQRQQESAHLYEGGSGGEASLVVCVVVGRWDNARMLRRPFACVAAAMAMTRIAHVHACVT